MDTWTIEIIKAIHKELFFTKILDESDRHKLLDEYWSQIVDIAEKAAELFIDE